MGQTEKPKKAMDLEIALAYVGGDLEFLSEMAMIFLQDYSRLMDEVRDSILQNNCSVLERAAHTMKGRLAFFGINRVRDKMLELEIMGREQDLTRANEVLAEAEIGMKAALSELELIVRKKSE